MSLIKTASIALVLGFAVAMSGAPASAAVMHHHHHHAKVVAAPHYKNPILGFFEAIFHPLDHDKDQK